MKKYFSKNLIITAEKEQSQLTNTFEILLKRSGFCCLIEINWTKLNFSNFAFL